MNWYNVTCIDICFNLFLNFIQSFFNCTYLFLYFFMHVFPYANEEVVIRSVSWGQRLTY